MRIIYSAILVLLITSCANVNGPKKISKPAAEANVTPFNKALAIEYSDFADIAFKDGNWMDSRKFKLKSENAAKGQEVLPEDIKNWKIAQEEVDNLHWASGRLDSVMIDSVKEAYPTKLAHLQRLFDCWVQRAARGAKKNKIEECRVDFVLETATLENILMPVLEVQAEAEDKSVIYFGVSSYDVNPDGVHVVNDTIEALSGMHDYSLEINGYADNSGDYDSNMKLSRKRTQAVADHFIINGIDKNVIEQNAYGEVVSTDSSSETKKNNRRVEINIESAK